MLMCMYCAVFSFKQNNQSVDSQAISELISNTSSLQSGDVALVTKALSSVILSTNFSDENVIKDLEYKIF